MFGAFGGAFGAFGDGEWEEESELFFLKEKRGDRIIIKKGENESVFIAIILTKVSILRTWKNN